MTTTVPTNREPTAPKPRDPIESIERGLAFLREISLNVQTEPLREMRLQMRLDVQIVYFDINIPVAGVALRIPALVTITPKLYSPTQAQHL
jgi:hypothetical protein